MTKALLKILGVFGVSLVMSGTPLRLLTIIPYVAEMRCRRRPDTSSVGSGRYTRVWFNISNFLNGPITDTNQP